MSGRATGSELFRAAAFFALLGGFAEVLGVGAIAWLGRTQAINRDVVWMVPVAYVVLFSALAVGLAVVGVLCPRARNLPFAAFVFGTLGAAAVTNLFGAIAKWAMVALSLGIGAQAARLVRDRDPSFSGKVRHTIPWAAAALVLIGTGMLAGPRVMELRATSRLTTPPKGYPNVLLMVLDTVRAQSLRERGKWRDTAPNLARLAGKGVLFERAIATAPWTLSSHASMFTGRLPHEVGGTFRTPLDPSVPTLAEHLRDRGYFTAGFVANTGYATYPFGLNRGFLHYEDYLTAPSEFVASSSLGRLVTERHQLRSLFGYYEVLGRKDAATVNRQFLKWLRGRDATRPFFAFLNYLDAHEPYLPPPPYDRRFGDPAIRKNENYRYWSHQATRYYTERMTGEEIRAELAAYEGAIAYLDAQIGALIAELERDRILDSTLIIVTSDHGEGFKEHGLFGHGNSLYMELLHVPLILSLPSRVPVEVAVGDTASLVDLPATVMSLLQLPSTSFPGRSLERFWDASRERSELDAAYSELTPEGQLRLSVIAGDWHLIENNDGSLSLYDLAGDPLETRDLIHSPRATAALSSLEPLLREAIAKGNREAAKRHPQDGR
jgi:arylsulfatase A-like enzyme